VGIISVSAFALFRQSSSFYDHGQEVSRLQFRERSLSHSIEETLQLSGGLGTSTSTSTSARCQKISKANGVLMDFNTDFSKRNLKTPPYLCFRTLAGQISFFQGDNIYGFDDTVKIPVTGTRGFSSGDRVELYDLTFGNVMIGDIEINDVSVKDSQPHVSFRSGTFAAKNQNNLVQFEGVRGGMAMVRAQRQVMMTLDYKNGIGRLLMEESSDRKSILQQGVEAFEVDPIIVIKKNDKVEKVLWSELGKIDSSLKKKELVLDTADFPAVIGVRLKILLRGQDPEDDFLETKTFAIDGKVINPAKNFKFQYKGRQINGNQFKWRMFTKEVFFRNSNLPTK